MVLFLFSFTHCNPILTNGILSRRGPQRLTGAQFPPILEFCTVTPVPKGTRQWK